MRFKATNRVQYFNPPTLIDSNSADWERRKQLSSLMFLKLCVVSHSGDMYGWVSLTVPQ